MKRRSENVLSVSSAREQGGGDDAKPALDEERDESSGRLSLTLLVPAGPALTQTMCYHL